MRITPNPFVIQPLPPEPPKFTTEILGWTFNRPLSSNFEVDQYPGYWALHLAALSRLVYSNETLVRAGLAARTSTYVHWFDRGSTQAVGYLHEGYACLVFRGTQELADWLIDATSIMYGSPGRHLGFHRAWKLVQTEVLQWLQTLPPHSGLITAGHSLGGALAILSAFELSDHIPVRAVRTFGAPRVGAMEFAEAYNRRLPKLTRQFKYDADAVTIIPPPPLFVHVSQGTRLQASLSTGEFDYPTSVFAAVAQTFNYTQIPVRMFSREPITAAILVALTFIVFFTKIPNYLLSHLPIYFTAVAHSRIGEALLIAVSIPLLEQLTYLIPVRISYWVRWPLSIAIVAALAVLHVNLLWLVPTLVWTFIIAVLLLRTLLPSATDHKMLGYTNALSRLTINGSFSQFNPNAAVYRELDLK